MRLQHLVQVLNVTLFAIYLVLNSITSMGDCKGLSIELGLATPELRVHISNHYFDEVKLGILTEIWRKGHSAKTNGLAKGDSSNGAKILRSMAEINSLLYEIVEHIRNYARIKSDLAVAQELNLEKETEQYSDEWNKEFKIIDEKFERLKALVLENEVLAAEIFPEVKISTQPKLKTPTGLVSFADPTIAEFWRTVDKNDQKAQSKAQAIVKNCPWAQYAAIVLERLDQINSVKTSGELYSVIPGLERYKPTSNGKYPGYFKVRIDRQFRLFFQYSDSGARNVTIDDYHNE